MLAHHVLASGDAQWECGAMMMLSRPQGKPKSFSQQRRAGRVGWWGCGLLHVITGMK